MIYITGDCHGEFGRLNKKNFPEQEEMTKEDAVIICGDFGGVWNRDRESREENYLMNWLEEKPFTTLFVDGNHENFDRLYACPQEVWHGGKVHRIRPSVIHLMRGQVFTVDGNRIFAFGGAASHDIDGGVLEPADPDFRRKKRLLDKERISYRVNHVSWWEQELPSAEEMEEGRRNLEANQYEVDFIVTHCCASSTQALIGQGLFAPDCATAYFEELRRKVTFKKWFFGHYHDNQMVSENEILLYEQIIRIS